MTARRRAAPPPSDPRQIEILLKIQRLVTEGAASRSSTYKFALLNALANLAVERGDDSGNPLPIPLPAIGEQFVRLRLEMLLQLRGEQLVEKLLERP